MSTVAGGEPQAGLVHRRRAVPTMTTPRSGSLGSFQPEVITLAVRWNLRMDAEISAVISTVGGIRVKVPVNVACPRPAPPHLPNTSRPSPTSAQVPERRGSDWRGRPCVIAPIARLGRRTTRTWPGTTAQTGPQPPGRRRLRAAISGC